MIKESNDTVEPVLVTYGHIHNDQQIVGLVYHPSNILYPYDYYTAVVKTTEPYESNKIPQWATDLLQKLVNDESFQHINRIYDCSTNVLTLWYDHNNMLDRFDQSTRDYCKIEDFEPSSLCTVVLDKYMTEFEEGYSFTHQRQMTMDDFMTIIYSLKFSDDTN